jgi:hypothetical protein
MSNLLNEAIVDAKALRSAALKNAESVVIERYSEEVRSTLEQMLEQEGLMADPLGAAAPDLGADPGAEMPAPEAPAPEMPMEDPLAAPGPEAGLEEIAEDEIPLGATDDFKNLVGKNLNGFPATGEDVELTLNLGALQESVDQLKETDTDEDDDEDLDEEIDITEADLAALLEEEPIEEDASAGVSAAAQEDADVKAMSNLEDEDEKDDDSDVNAAVMANESLDADELVDAIVEKLTVDMGADLAGWAGRSSEANRREIEKEIAHRRSTDEGEGEDLKDLETLKKAQEELVFENKQLNEQNTQYKQAFHELKDSLQDVNLSNARLLYTNRVLRNASLNERQKIKIAEAISGAGSVTEARTIYDTLQSTVETAPKRGPQSLSEAIGRRSSVLRATRASEKPSSDPQTDRMKKLAGIK